MLIFEKFQVQILHASLFIVNTVSSAAFLILSSFYSEERKIINLPIPSRWESKRGDVKIGRIVKKNRRKYNYYLNRKDLERHMFICGFTGAGKSNFVQNFILNFKRKEDIPFFLVEFKGEYKFLKKRINNILLLSPGENFSINIFNPELASPIIHSERLFEIFKSSHLIESNAEYSPQMEKVLVDILKSACTHEKMRSWKGFYQLCDKYLTKYQSQIPQLKQTIISIKNRIRRFSAGPLKKVFCTNFSISIQEILSRDCILDLSSIIRLGGDKEDAFFFLNVFLKYLWDYNLSAGAYQGIKHISIIEDAQYFIPKNLVKRSKISTYLEDIALLQRGTGECLICIATRPDVSEEILANSGIVVSFKNHYEKEILGELLGLNKKNFYFLSNLKEGQCVIRVNSIKDPFVLQIPFVKNKIIDKKRSWNSSVFVLKLKALNRVIKNSGKSLSERLEKTLFKINRKSQGRIKKSFSKPKKNNLVGFKMESSKEIIEKKNLDKKDSCLKGVKIVINNLKERIHKAKNFYTKENFGRCKLECQKIIEDLLIQIAHRLNYKFSSISEFLSDIENDNLVEKFSIHTDLKKVSEIIKHTDINRSVPKEDAKLLLKYTIKIFLKLNESKKIIKLKQNKYSDAYLHYLKKVEGNYSDFRIKKDIKEVQISIDEEDFFTLKKYIDELLNLEVKRLS